MDTREENIRIAVFQWLEQQVAVHGDVLPSSVLRNGFDFDGELVYLQGPQGIFKPRQFESAPLSITTSIAGPYDDNSSGEDGLLRYRYRGTNPGHSDNVGMRLAFEKQIPLVYFLAVVEARYLAVWPVFVVKDEPEKLTFSIAVDDAKFSIAEIGGDWDEFRIADSAAKGSRRAYVTASVRQRLHQRSFRERVLRAYRQQCAFCRLKLPDLLDAAHIVPDSEGGEPSVSNGMALCKLHHAAFDRYFLGVRPDCTIEVPERVLVDKDGPMLLHGLQGLNGKSLLVPSRADEKPDPQFLEQRYDQFKGAA